MGRPETGPSGREREAEALREHLAALVRAQGLTLRTLAQRAGLHHSTLSRVLAGKTAPTEHLLRALGPHLGVDAATLVGRGAEGEGGDADLSQWGLPKGVGPAEFRAALERMTTLAGGAEVEGLVRAGFGSKRASLGQTGMAGPALGRLDALYDLYTGREGERLPQALRRRVAGALLYFLLSVDAIPDDLYPVGYLDDAWVADLVWREVERFRAGDAGHG